MALPCPHIFWRPIMILHEKISAQLPEWRERIKSLAKEHGEVKVDDVTVSQIVGGMRDIKSLLTDVSFVDPAHGILFRDMTIPELLKKLPKARGARCHWWVVCITC